MLRKTIDLSSKEFALILPHLIAQTTTTSTPTTVPATTPPFWANPIFLPLILMGIFLFFSSRTKRSKDKQVADMLGNLKRGDRIQTIGGIIGTVVEARETEVLVKVDESNNTKIRFSRKAIHRVLEDETTTVDKK